MIKKKEIFYILSVIIFIILTVLFYFSERNIINTQKIRSMHSIKVKNKLENLPLMKNNTKNIIEISDEVESYKKKKKKYLFWKLLEK